MRTHAWTARYAQVRDALWTENLALTTPQAGTERAAAASLPTHRRRALGPGLRLTEAVEDGTFVGFSRSPKR
jgi:hypothetical protein